ncbi:hypothetical protein BDZ89DRAFT_1133447 [Hymenopellis radicata]|nr:hypothetical protein BDZ89DRAFT_1133447 [Hymenopellis radicata]
MSSSRCGPSSETSPFKLGRGYATLCEENKDLHARNDELEQEMADAKTTIWVLKQRLCDMESRYRTACKEKWILVEENTKLREKLNSGDDEMSMMPGGLDAF